MAYHKALLCLLCTSRYASMTLRFITLKLRLLQHADETALMFPHSNYTDAVDIFEGDMNV